MNEAPRPATRSRGASRGLGPAVLVLLTLPLLSPSDARAHLGGLVASLRFTEPSGITITTANSLTIRWLDSDNDPTAVFELAYQIGNVPPLLLPHPSWFQGTAIGQVAANDLANSLEWQLGALPPGAYFLYAKALDDPVCTTAYHLDGLVILRRAGQPDPLGLLVVDPPLGNAASTTEGFVTIEAYSSSTPSVTISAGVLVGDVRDPFAGNCDPSSRTWEKRFDLATNVPLPADTASGNHRWRGTLSWNLSSIPDGNYVFEVTARNGSDQVARAFSLGHLTVRRTTPDGGAPADGGSPSDGGTGPSADGGMQMGGGGGCQAAPDSARGLALAFVATAIALVSRRKRRAPSV